ncbi:hypothetical protein LSTR_LSTR007132 [Laodelphax striatellus]|uniref:VWFC domain-containing protein n=1 Tax=Laodelphax striatellus TaxID=195883 RepID=A0A482XI30_LAOST|nr:hypothetical protein LSTR_LSTR007132 [Laodelphax striatellus]
MLARQQQVLGWFSVLWIFIFAFVTLPDRNSVICARRHLPLHGDDMFRKSQHAAECQFGKQLRELGSSWFADLGPPFGVMYCIKCECLPYQKKRRVVGKVHCRNIKNECPKPSCDEPVLAPGRCCKVCPGDLDSPDIVDDPTTVVSGDDEKNTKHFAALLTNRNQMDSSDMMMLSATGNFKQYVATGRFMFHKRNLYYSFYTSNAVRPRGLQFVDLKGNILEEQVLAAGSVYQNKTGKICGVWRRIPREYRRLIRDEKLLVVLLWDKAELTITGQLYRYRSLTTELFSVLLEGSNQLAGLGPPQGGTALVSVSTTAPSLHLTIIFTGLFGGDEIQGGKEGTVSVKLASLDGKTIVIDETLKLDKPSADLNTIEVRSAVSHQDLHLLSHLQLQLLITNSKQPHLVVGGSVLPRTTCEIYVANIVAHSTDAVASPNTAVSGLSWVFVNKEGALDYHVLLEGGDPDMKLSLVVDRRHQDIASLTPTLSKDGWANGTSSVLGLRNLDHLYSGELAWQVVGGGGGGGGRLSGRPLADARDASAPSLLLRTSNSTSWQSADKSTGMVWAAVDVECNLHYELTLAGLSPTPDHPLQLYLEEVPFIAPGAPVSHRLLQEFSTSNVEDFILGLTPQELMRLDSGVVYFEVKDAKSGESVMRGQWKEVTIPTSCLPLYTENQLPTLNDEAGISRDTGCFHGDRFHEEGAQWMSQVDRCVMCTCHSNRVTCDAVQCPTLTCDKPVTRPEACCAVCDNNAVETNATIGQCQLAGQSYRPGATWHPYIPPNGFDTCTTCSCNATSLKVSCHRTVCPQLHCEERIAVRHPGACCRVCPLGSATSTLDPGWMGEQATGPRSKSDILAAGGCNYPIGGPFENGEQWHPRVYSQGEVKWVKCHCKDGKVRCERSRGKHM